MWIEAFRNGLIMISICLPGFFLNLFSGIVLLRHPSFNNPFGRLNAIHTFSNAGLLLIFLLWSVPCTMIDQSLEYVSFINHRMGQLAIFFQEVSYHTCLFISFNRFLAIGRPALSRRMFNGRRTNMIIFFIFSLCTTYGLLYFIPGCNFYFDFETDIWIFQESFCGGILSMIDLYYNVALFLVIGFLDMTTLFMLKGANKRIFESMKTSSAAEVRRRQKKEIMFFIQAAVNTLTYCIMLICFHIISTWTHSLLEIFLCTTIAWAAAHSAGGLIVFLFNVEIRRNILFWRTKRGESVRLSGHTNGTFQNVASPTANIATIKTGHIII